MQSAELVPFLVAASGLLVIVVIALLYLFLQQRKENRLIKYPVWMFRSGLAPRPEGSLIDTESVQGADDTNEYIREFRTLQSDYFNDGLLGGADFLYDLERRFRTLHDHFNTAIGNRVQSVLDDNARLERRVVELDSQHERSMDRIASLQSELKQLRTEITNQESMHKSEVEHLESRLSDTAAEQEMLVRTVEEIEALPHSDWQAIVKYLAERPEESPLSVLGWDSPIQVGATDPLRSMGSAARQVLGRLREIPSMGVGSESAAHGQLAELKEAYDSRREDFERRLKMKRGTKIVPGHYYRIVEEIDSRIKNAGSTDANSLLLLYNLGIFTLDRLIENFTLSSLSDYV